MGEHAGELINFRDFGDKRAFGGRHVGAGLLFRCGHLADVTSEHLGFLLKLDLTTVADLRYMGEREQEPSPWPPEFTDRIVFHSGERDTEAPHVIMIREGSLTLEAVQAFYLEFYRDLPYDSLYRPLFAETLRRAADQGGPLLVHCAAGKDRTGIMCALILHCLGVSREEIVRDYMRSAQAPGLLAMKPAIIRRALRRHGHQIPEDAIDALLSVLPEYINTTFETIEARDGTIEAYLAQSGVNAETLEKLRARFLRD